MRNRYLLVLVVLALAACAFGHEWPSAKHTCVHDALDTTHLINAPILGQATGLDNLPAGTTQPLRVKVVSLSGDDPERECTREGERVKVGSITSTRRGDICGEKDNQGNTVTTNCIFVCGAADVMSTEKRTFLGSVLKDTESFFLDTLRIQRQLPVPVTTSQCGGHPLVYPSTPNPKRVSDADYILYVTTRPTVGQTLAFAVTCEFDQQTTGRPIVGWANFGPAQVYIDDPGVEAVARHEISHALGFSASSWGRFRNRQTGEVRPASDTTYTAQVPQGKGTKSVLRLKTEKVLEAARTQFGCDTLDGVELENNGGAGTASSHWEKRYFGNDFMIGSKGTSAVYSPMTFAAFHDSGWYDVNFESKHIGVNPWGAGLGCDFARATCDQDQWKNLGAPYYCTEGTRQCTFDQTSWGSCSLAEYSSNLPPEFQYFSEPNVGGLSVLDDYCPIFVAMTGRDCSEPPGSPLVTGGDGADLSAKYLDARGSSWGRHAGGGIGRCFETSLNRNTEFFTKLPSIGCYQQACVGPNRAKVKVGARWYDCPTGKTLTDEDFFEEFGSGGLTCHDNSVMCGDAPINPNWPDISDVVPKKASADGGDLITISGVNMNIVTKAFISDLPCEIRSSNSTALVCETGSGKSSGVGDVYLITAQEVSTSSAKGLIAIDRDCNFACRLEEWMKEPTDDWWNFAPNGMLNYMFVIGCVIILAMIITCCCHCRRRSKAKAKRKYLRQQQRRRQNPQQTGYREMREVQL